MNISEICGITETEPKYCKSSRFYSALHVLPSLLYILSCFLIVQTYGKLDGIYQLEYQWQDLCPKNTRSRIQGAHHLCLLCTCSD